MNSVGKIIRNARQSKGYTQEELALKVGVQKSAIAKWENGRVSEIKRSNLKALAIALDLDPNALLSPDSEATIQQDYVVSLPVQLTAQEEQMLSLFRKLGSIDQGKLIAYGEGLLAATDDIGSRVWKEAERIAEEYKKSIELKSSVK